MAELPWACPECGAHFQSSFAHCPKDGSKLGARDGLVGHELGGRYTILSRIGAGAMGAVYAANDRRLEKRVAIKLLSEEVSSGVQVDRFRQEAKALSLLHHENIVEILDFQRERGRHYFAMEFLRGEDLESLLARKHRLDLDRTYRIIDQCARALGAAHKQGIVHRDLKPANIFLIERESRADFVKVLDFGVAKLLTEDDGSRPLTRIGETWGTPYYMSPERAEGLPSDGRSDVYGLGVIIFEMLSGVLPFEGDSPLHVMQQHVEDPPPRFADLRQPAEVPLAVEQLVLKALAKRPEHRFESMSALNTAFREAVRSARTEKLHEAFVAYNVVTPSALDKERLAALDPEAFRALENLRRTLGREHARVLAELQTSPGKKQ